MRLGLTGTDVGPSKRAVAMRLPGTPPPGGSSRAPGLPLQEHQPADADVTFLLTTAGHNASIVSEPDRPGRSFRSLTKAAGDKYLDPEAWEKIALRKEGSWWPEWFAWLEARSGGPAAPPSLGAAQAGYPPLCPAPGRYVFQR